MDVAADQETKLGRDAQRYIAAGQYVPDEITNMMLRERLEGIGQAPASSSTAIRARSRK